MHRLLTLGTSAIALAATPAFARDRQITPYIEVSQVLAADLNGPDDVLTYTAIAAGVDATIQSSRVAVQISYRYEQRIDWSDRLNDAGIHTGLARAAMQVTPNLSVEGGAIAARARSDFRGAAPGNLAGNVSNTSQFYSAYAGPTYVAQVGDATVNAAYRFGYTKVEQPSQPAVLPGQPRRDNYDDSTNHMAVASIGTPAGTILPVGVTASAAWRREDAGQLDQRYEGAYARGDIVAPVSPQVALTAGAGYEKIEISQRDPLLVPGTAEPVIDNNGRFVTDPGSPRRLAYRTDGLYWDAGVIYRPSQRTTLQGRVGRRYNGWSYTGSLSHQLSGRTGLNIGVYDSVDSIGRGLSDALNAMPTSFEVSQDPFGNQFGGCTFGVDGKAAGNCLTPLIGALTTAQFRSRGVTGVLSTEVGPWFLGLGLGYANRRYLVDRSSVYASLFNVSDEIWFGQATIGRELSARSNVSANAYFNYFNSGSVGAPDVTGGGGNASYSYSFGRLGATASVGVYAFDQDGVGKDVSGQALLGMRYSF
jgi:hypothetical protein